MISRQSSASVLGDASVQLWPIARLVPYARNPRKNDAAVDRMCASIQEFGFKIPVLARSSGEVVDGHLRLKAAKKLGISGILRRYPDHTGNFCGRSAARTHFR